MLHSKGDWHDAIHYFFFKLRKLHIFYSRINIVSQDLTVNKNDLLINAVNICILYSNLSYLLTLYEKNLKYINIYINLNFQINKF